MTAKIKYLVTGAAGLIGSAMVWELNNRNIASILAVDHLGVGSDKWKNLRALDFADYVERDGFWETYGADDGFWRGLDGIVHLGACSATTETDATYLVHNNFEYTKRIAECALRHRVRLIYASSCATYGDGAKGYDDDESRIGELRPLNMYGYSKQLFDLYAAKQGWLNSITACKFSNVYGPNELHKGGMRSVVCRAYEQITATGKLQLFKSYRADYADGEQQRDFLYVKDAVRMLWFLLNRRDGAGIYNIGSGRAESWNALARAAFAALERPVDLEYIDMPESLRDRYQYYTQAEMAKLQRLGWTEEATSLTDAIRDYYSYRNRDAYLGDDQS